MDAKCMIPAASVSRNSTRRVVENRVDMEAPDRWSPSMMDGPQSRGDNDSGAKFVAVNRR